MAKMTKEQKLEKFKKIFEEAELEFAFPEPVTQKGIECNVYEEPRFRLTKKQLIDFLKYQDPDDNEVEEYIANHPDEKEWYFDAGLSVRYDLVNDGYNPTVKINDYRDVLENCLIVRYSSEHTDGNLNNPMEIRILDDEILNTVYNRVKEHMEENIKKFNEIVEIKDFSKNLSWSDFTEQDFNRLKTSLFENIGDANIDDNIDKVNSSALGDYYGRVKAGDVHIELIPEINMYEDGKEFVAIEDNYYYPVLDVKDSEDKSPEGINYTYEPGGSFHASEIKDMNYEQFQEYVGTYIYNTIKDSPELLERASKPTIDWNSRETGSPLYNQIYNNIKIKDFTKEDFYNLVNEWAETNSVVGNISVGDIEGDIFFWENLDLTVENYIPALVDRYNLLEAENGYFNYYELSGADEPIIKTNNKLRDFNYKNFCKFIKEQWTSQILDNDILLKHAVRDNISWDKYEKLIEKIYDKYTKDWKKTHDYIEGVQEPASIDEFSTNELLEPEIVEKLIGYPDFDLYLNLMETDFREYRKEKELKLQKENQWETVEQYFPDYHSSSSITLSNDIAAWEEGVNDDFKTLEDFQNRWGKHFESKEMILEYGKRFDELLYKTACAYRDNSPIKEDLLWACEHADYDTLLPSQIDFHINEINTEEKYIRTISYLPEDIVTKLGLETNNKYRILLDTDVAGDLQLFVIQSDDWRGNPLDDDIGVTEEVFKEKTGIDILDVYRHQAVKLAEKQEQKNIVTPNDLLLHKHIKENFESFTASELKIWLKNNQNIELADTESKALIESLDGNYREVGIVNNELYYWQSETATDEYHKTTLEELCDMQLEVEDSCKKEGLNNYFSEIYSIALKGNFKSIYTKYDKDITKEKFQNAINEWNHDEKGTNSSFEKVEDLHLVDPDSIKQQELLVKNFKELSIPIDKSLAKTILEMANFDEETYYFMFDEGTGNFVEINRDEKIVDVESPDGMLNYISDEISYQVEEFSNLSEGERKEFLKDEHEAENIKNLIKLNKILDNIYSFYNKPVVIEDAEWGDVFVVKYGRYNGNAGFYYGLFNQHMDISNVEDNLSFYTEEQIIDIFKDLKEPNEITVLDIAKQILIDHQDYGWQRTDSEKDYSEQWLKQTGTELSSKDQQEYLNKLDELLNEKTITTFEEEYIKKPYFVEYYLEGGFEGSSKRFSTVEEAVQHINDKPDLRYDFWKVTDNSDKSWAYETENSIEIVRADGSTYSLDIENTFSPSDLYITSPSGTKDIYFDCKVTKVINSDKLIFKDLKVRDLKDEYKTEDEALSDIVLYLNSAQGQEDILKIYTKEFGEKQVQTKLLPEKYEGYTTSVFEPRFTDILNELKPKGMKPFTDEEVKDLFVYTGTDIFKVENGHLNRYYTDTLSNDKLVFQCEGLGSLLKMVEDWSWDSAGNTMKDENDTLDPNYLSNIHFKNRLKEFNREAAKEKLIAGYEGKYYITAQRSAFHDVLNAFTPEGMKITDEECNLILDYIGVDEEGYYGVKKLYVEDGKLVREINDETDSIRRTSLSELLNDASANAYDDVFSNGKWSAEASDKLNTLIKDFNLYTKIEQNPLNFNFSGFDENEYKKFQERIKENQDAHEYFYGEVGDIWIHAFDHENDDNLEVYYTVFADEEGKYYSDGEMKTSIDSADYDSKIILTRDFIINSDYDTFINYIKQNVSKEIFQNEKLLTEAQRPLLINWYTELAENTKNQKMIERKLQKDMDFSAFTWEKYQSMIQTIIFRDKENLNHQVYGYFEVGDMRISIESLEQTDAAKYTITLRPEYPGTNEDFNYEASIDGKNLKVSYKYDDVDIPCGNLSYEEFKKAVILPLAENLNRNKLNEHVLKDNISWADLAVKKEPEHIVTTSVNFNCGYVFDDDTRNGTEEQKQEVIKAVVETIKDKYEISENDVQIQSFNDMVNIGFAFPVPLEYCYPQDKTDEWVKSIDKQLNADFGMYVNWEGGERVEDKFNSKEQARDFITKVMEYKFRPNVDYVMSNITPEDDLYEVQMLTEDEINFFLDNHHEYYPIRDFLNRSYQPKAPVKNLYGNLYVSKNGNAVIDIVSETENGETRVNDYRLDAYIPSSLYQKYQEAITLYDYKQEREIQFEKYEENGAKLRILKDIFDFTKTIPDFSENDAKLICELMCADPEVDGFSFLKDHFIRKDLQAHVEVNMTVPEVLELCRQNSHDILIDSNENNPEYETLKNNYERINRMSDYFDFGFISNALKNHHDRSFEEQRKLVNDNSKYVHIISIEDNATRICEEILSNDFKLNFSMIPVSGMAENVQKAIDKLISDNAVSELSDNYINLAILVRAGDYFNNVFDRPRPTAEDIQRAVEDGWSFETAINCYTLAYSPDDIDERLEVINRIDVSNLFESDIEAALYAEKDGIKLIPVEEMDFSKDADGTYSCYRYTDTEKNREVLKELGFMKQEIELKPGMKFFTASKESDHFLIVGNRTVQKISKDKKMIMDNRGVEYFVDSSEVIYDEKSFDNYFSKGPEKWSTQGGGGWKHFVVNHIEDGMIRIYPANVTEDRYDDIYHVTYFDEPIVNKDVSTWNKAGDLYYADNVNVLKKHLMEQLNIGNLSQNQEMNLKPEQYYEKLCSAMENKDNQTVADCIDNLKDTNNLHHYLDQALFGSITIHDFDTFKKLVENGANIDWKIEDPENAGATCNVLHFAAYKDDARFINYVNEFLNKPRDLLTLSEMLKETDGYDETPFDISFRWQQENEYELDPYHYNECLTTLAEMIERVSDKERMIYQDISTGNYLTVEQSDLLYMIDLYDANKNWLKHDSFEGYIDPETKEDREIKSKYHAGLTAMDDLIREGKWSSRINYRELSHNEQLSEELNVSREEGMYVAYRADFNVKIKLAEDELNLQPELLEAALFNNLKRIFGSMDADQREYFYTSTHEDTDFNGNNLYSGNFSLNVPAEYCNPKEKADMWVKSIIERVKELPGYFSAEKLEVKDDYLENRGAIERYKADRAVLDRFTVKDWNNLVTLNEGFDHSSTMVTDDYSKLTYARLKDNVRRYYSDNATPILSVGKLTKFDDFYELDNLDDYYLASTLGKQLEEDFALEVCNMIVESLKEDELQIIKDSINPDKHFNHVHRTNNIVTYYEEIESLYADFADCNIKFSIIYDSNSNEIYTNSDMNVTRSDESNFHIDLPAAIDTKLNEKLDKTLKASGLSKRDLFVHPSPVKGFDKNNQISVNEFALFMQKKGMNIPSETCAIILKYMDFEDYKIYQDFNDNLCIYDNSEDFNGKGEVYTPEQLLEFTKSQIQKAEELGYSNFNKDDFNKINKALGLNSMEQNHKQRDSSLEEMMNDYDSRPYKNPLETEVHPVFGEIKKMLPFCKNPNDPCEALNLLCHKWDNEGQSEKKREVLKYISQNTKTDVKSLTAYFEKNLNMKVSITPPGKKEPEQTRSKHDDSGLGR